MIENVADCVLKFSIACWKVVVFPHICKTYVNIQRWCFEHFECIQKLLTVLQFSVCIVKCTNQCLNNIRMYLSSNVLIPLPLTCFIDFHDVEGLIFIVLTGVSLFFNFGFIIRNFIRWAGLKVFAGHDVTEDLCLD